MQLNQIVSGFMAVANLTATQQPDNAWMVNLANNLGLKVNGRTMTMTLEMPITDVMERILFQNLSPREALEELLARSLKPETW